ITIAPPDVTVSSVTGRRLNVYLFQLAQNGHLSNQDVHMRDQPGQPGSPPLSLDLHYLLTAHGETETGTDADLDAQEILGDAMRVLHDYAIISPNLHQQDDATLPTILDSNLLGAFERIKLSLQPVSLEELVKIWTALPDTSLRRSVAYQVSV